MTNIEFLNESKEKLEQYKRRCRSVLTIDDIVHLDNDLFLESIARSLATITDKLEDNKND